MTRIFPVPLLDMQRTWNVPSLTACRTAPADDCGNASCAVFTGMPASSTMLQLISRSVASGGQICAVISACGCCGSNISEPFVTRRMLRTGISAQGGISGFCAAAAYPGCGCLSASSCCCASCPGGIQASGLMPRRTGASRTGISRHASGSPMERTRI